MDSPNIFALRNTAKEILAAAVLDLFPAAQLLAGHVDEIGFSYDFFFPSSQISLFSKKELEHIEDRARHFIQQNLPIRQLEMMKENAANYLEHLGQPFRAQLAMEEEANIVSLLEMGAFRDLCMGPFLKQTKDIKVFQLLDFLIVSSEHVRIFGTAFFESKELKEFLKRYRESKKHNYLVLGPKLGFFTFFEERMVLLPKGEKLFQEWRDFWRSNLLEEGFSFLSYEEEELREEIHEGVLASKKLKKVAAFQTPHGDLASIQYENENELYDALISSLHFIRKAFKIFGFETRAVCLAAKPMPLSLVLEKEGFDYELVKNRGAPMIEWRATDHLGREKILSFLRIEEEKMLLHRSLFWSLENWIALYIEKGVKRV